MEYVKKLFNRKSVIVVLLVFLTLSTVLNIYQFLGYSGSKPAYEYSTGAWVSGDLEGMGGITVFLSNGSVVPPEMKFNVTGYMRVWAPYTGSETWNISCKLYRSQLWHEESVTLVAETNMTMHKSKDAMMAWGSTSPIALVAPSTGGIWIYTVWAQYFSFHFVITVCSPPPVEFTNSNG